jgi:hypothetical protein
MSSLPGLFRVTVSILLSLRSVQGAYRRPLVRGLYRLLFNRTWSNNGLAYTAIFVYSWRVMSLLVFDSVHFLLFWLLFGFLVYAMVTGNTVCIIGARLPCT